MTPERLIKTGVARRISRDDTGVLWGMNWQHRGVTLDSWSAVEVTEGVAGPHGVAPRCILPVPTNLRTAREALAWIGSGNGQDASLQPGAPA